MSHQNMSEHLFEKAAVIATQIQSSDEAARYWQAKEKMGRNERAIQLFEELKRKTNNALVVEERFGRSHAKYIEMEQAMRGLEEELATIPVAHQYKEAQDELNGLVQEVVQVLLRRISTSLPIELGAKQGCGQGHDGNGCSCGHQ